MRLLGFYPLCFEEMSIWLIKDFNLQVPFGNAGSCVTELHSIDSRFERPTLAYVLRYNRRALVWFLSECLDGGDVLFSCFLISTTWNSECTSRLGESTFGSRAELFVALPT